MKKQHLVLLAITVIAVFFGIYSLVSIYFQGTLPQIKDPSVLISAVHHYSLDLVRQKQPMPDTVSLQELITKGYVNPDAVRAFEGMTVTISLTNSTSPDGVFIRAQLPDGGRLTVLNDGTVQTAPK